MKLLVFTDRGGNSAEYKLAVPDTMQEWRTSAFRTYIGMPAAVANGVEGFLPEPTDPVRHESFRLLMTSPASTLNDPVALVQCGSMLTDEATISLADDWNAVELFRDDAETAPGHASDNMSIADRQRDVYQTCVDDISAAFDELFEFERYPVVDRQGKSLTGLRDIAPGDGHDGTVNLLAEKLDAGNQTRFLLRVALAIHEAPFENLSKLVDGIPFRSGAEMWTNMARGFGGVCGEKTGALQFICHVLGVPSRPVLGSTSEFPSDIEERIADCAARRCFEDAPLWAQHCLLEAQAGEMTCLIDPTNGNVPFLFLTGTDRDAYMKAGYRARMVSRVERLNLRRVTAVTGDQLFTWSEFHVPDMLHDYVFDQGLGLHISAQAYIAVYFDWGGERSALMEHHFASLAKRRRFPHPRFVHAGNMSCVPDPALRRLLEAALDALRMRCADPAYTGDFTFVIQPLTPHFWQRPRISPEVREQLWPEGIDGYD
ncbi:MAG: hypothetical protein HN742_02535 [Lentisphaerae bacterium]|jgi:hypothetical protein|nr:hypothetical protein [Lentisphaerota bacterium]MBT4819669.1 hypothetical protein [Lentisphaerota bacterium]MBT5608047.1 hypothetical protein [Lentisphaerota bacterium]MBT7056485.1 hypothetical protein [Lentisphaerota bacterium]MBT7840716.1 hypothetical protein [Lentisphaerota bacterium]